jgi:hypothetical protein
VRKRKALNLGGMAAATALWAATWAAAGCASGDQDQVWVFIAVPQGVEFDGFQLVKVVDGRPVAMSRPQARPGSEHATNVTVPRGSLVLLQARAFQGSLGVAAGQATLTAGNVHLELMPCQPPRPLDEAFDDCQSAPRGDASPSDSGSDPDGGRPPMIMTATADSGLPPAPDATPSSAWTPPSCTIPGPGRASPLEVPPRCQDYCNAVETGGCGTRIYPDRDHCLTTCAVLDWQEGPVDEDTIACRIAWATSMPSDPMQQDDRCYFASLDPRGACGDLCVSYCAAGVRICGDHFPPLYQCVAGCALSREHYRMAGDDLDRHLWCRFDELGQAIFDSSLCALAAPNNRCGGDCLAVFLDLR